MFSKFTNSFINDFEPESLFAEPSQITFRSFSRGETIFSENEAIEKIFFILKGKIEINKISDSELLKMRTAAKGDIVGIEEIFTDKRYSTSAIVSDPVNAIEISIESFIELVDSNENFRFWLLKYLSSISADRIR